MDDSEFRTRLDIDVTVLELWVEEGWVRPRLAEGRRVYHPADLARARLILDLTRRMGVNDEGVDVVMDLVDQLHGVRGTLRAVMKAIETQDDETRLRIVRSMNRG